MWVTKKKELFAQNDQILQFCSLPVHLVPCWRVGWWLWRAGCISQDTYLLYFTKSKKNSFFMPPL